MVAQQQPHRYTVEEWRALLDSSDTKYEYRDGWIVAMAGGSAAHARIAMNVARILEDGLGEGPCLVYSSDLAVRLSPTEYRFPDATVTCDERDRPTRDLREIQAPRVIVEVLSESTEQEDRTAKFTLYRACPTVEEYMMVATRAQGVEVYRRSGDAWLYRSYGPGAAVDLASIGVTFAVDQCYRLTDVPGLTTPG
jgi:Uma2 family endonuclease